MKIESSQTQLSNEALALIPARGGSKGIPGKNLQLVGGRSLVVRSIDAARASKAVRRIVVTTNDPVIRAVATEAGAEVVDRPTTISGDTATSESALLHAITSLKQFGSIPERLVFLQCTSPFTSAAQIDQVLHALDDPTINSSFSVRPWHGFIWREDGRGINHDPKRPRQRRQDLEPTYMETGAIYAMRTAAFLQRGSRFCAPWRPVVLEDSGPDIDSPTDLALCRHIEALNTSL